MEQLSFAARQTLDEAVHDVRLVGGVYLVLGALLMAMFGVRPARTSWPLRVALLADSVMLFGPGLWYLFAGSYLKRLQGWPVSVSIRVGLAQLVVILLGVLIGVATRGDLGMLIAPAFVACVFVPALIAVMFSLRRAGRMIRLLDAPGHAFQPVNVKLVIPPDASVPAGLPLQWQAHVSEDRPTAT
jgi:hypothetical protein